MLDANFINAIDGLLKEISSAADGAKRISEADAIKIRDKIVASIPTELRFLYPENDTLAALAFAEVYYTLHMEDK